MTVSKYYCTTVDISPGGLQIQTKKPFPLGEQVEITINLEGQNGAFNLSGVTRWIAPSKDEPGSYVLGIELDQQQWHGAAGGGCSTEGA